MTNNIKAGDRVQHKTWKGDVSTRGHEVACVTKVLGEPHAILEGGSAWPCSELVKMPAESTEYQIQLEKDWIAQYLGVPSDKLPIPAILEAQDETPEAEYYRLLSEAHECLTSASRTPKYEPSLRRMKLICAKATIQDALDALPPANEIHVEGK